MRHFRNTLTHIQSRKEAARSVGAGAGGKEGLGLGGNGEEGEGEAPGAGAEKVDGENKNAQGPDWEAVQIQGSLIKMGLS